MNTQKNQSYQDRLKKMKDRIKRDKGILDSDFPDDVTFIGDPDLLKKADDEIDDQLEEGDNDEQK